MKLQILLFLLSLLAVAASALATQKAVIVSYPNETPDSVVSQAMDAVREAVSLESSRTSRLHLANYGFRAALLHMNIVSAFHVSTIAKFL